MMSKKTKAEIWDNCKICFSYNNVCRNMRHVSYNVCWDMRQIYMMFLIQCLQISVTSSEAFEVQWFLLQTLHHMPSFTQGWLFRLSSWWPWPFKPCWVYLLMLSSNCIIMTICPSLVSKLIQLFHLWFPGYYFFIFLFSSLSLVFLFCLQTCLQKLCLLTLSAKINLPPYYI